MIRLPPRSTLFTRRSSDLHSIVKSFGRQREVEARFRSTNDQLYDASFGAQFMSSRSEEHTSELQSQFHLVCRLLLEKKKLNNLIQRNPSPAYSSYNITPTQ